MDIFNWCLVLEEGTVKNKLNGPVQRCLCVRKKCQPFPLVFVGADLWECETLGAIAIPFGSCWKEKRFGCSLHIKIQSSLLGQKTNFFFFFLSFFCCYLSLPDWSALCSPSVWAAQKRMLRQRMGEGGKRREKDLWIEGTVYGRKRTQWQRQRCFGLRKFAADQRKLW